MGMGLGMGLGRMGQLGYSLFGSPGPEVAQQESLTGSNLLPSEPAEQKLADHIQRTEQELAGPNLSRSETAEQKLADHNLSPIKGTEQEVADPNLSRSEPAEQKLAADPNPRRMTEQEKDILKGLIKLSLSSQSLSNKSPNGD